MPDIPISGFASGSPIVASDELVIARGGDNFKITFAQLIAALQAGLQFKDEGGNLGASGTADTVDFVGAGVAASRIGNVVTVSIGGGGGAMNIGDPIGAGTANRVLFEGAGPVLADSANFTYTTGTGRLTLATTGAGAGILIGGDADFYRFAASTLRTSGSLTVDFILSTNALLLTAAASITMKSNSAFSGKFAFNEALTGTRTLNFVLNDADRTLTFAGNAVIGRTITGTANQITVTDGDGVAGNPTLSLPADVVIPAIVTVPNTGLHVLDTNASHDLIIKPGSDITADRTFTLTTGDADRTLTMTGNATLNQDVSTAGGPTFASLILTGKLGSYNGAAPTNGQLLIGHTANGTFEKGTLTNGTNITTTLGAGAVTINAVPKRIVGATIDGGGATPTIGTVVYVKVPFAGTITAATIIGDPSGSAVVDVWKEAANVLPTNADSIAAAAKPTLSSDDIAVDSTLTGWTTSVSANDVFGFELESVTTCTRISVELTIQES